MAAVAVPTAPKAEPAPAVWNGVLTQEKVGLIQSSYAKIDEKIGALGFGKEFYTVLFEMAPAAQALFKSGREAQSKMFAGMLTTLVKNIDNADKVVPVLQALATRHVRYGVKEAHFPIVGAGLLATLEKVLATDFTPPVREAWTELYGITQTVMWAKMEEVIQGKPAE
ncbi:non-symbiotic hemoglobin [Klebsormidium nitens]|uniref:Non-symbiotic hemoglobin n=1 Tax=Klebsormidium nitens TaxID=105231 RepID=A0A1Y1I094_KLENI|nr:non-symbiotic hemoglobin [Klebsormidium nitens]|eukprot:GAQ82196.1 non-symbiotic hemoglobin [Klebsormidium nitens]